MAEFLRVALLVLLSLAVPLPAAAQSPGAFEQANRAYAEGRYEEAREGYLSLVAAGEYSANLFYNLGNTLVKLEDPGRAMLNYERALALNPAHPEAAADLALLRERTGATVVSRRWTQFIYPAIRPGAFAAVVAAGAWALLFAIAGIALRAGRRRPWIGLALVALAVIAYALPPCCLASLEDDRAVVVAPKSVGRFAPVATSGSAATLPAGSHVRVLAPRGDWIYAELPDSQRVWIPATDLEQVRLSRS